MASPCETSWAPDRLRARRSIGLTRDRPDRDGRAPKSPQKGDDSFATLCGRIASDACGSGVGADRLLAEDQLDRDLRVRAALGAQLQDLELAFRTRIYTGIGSGSRDAPKRANGVGSGADRTEEPKIDQSGARHRNRCMAWDSCPAGFGSRAARTRSATEVE